MIHILAEHEVSPDTHADIQSLRNACFPECQVPRSYFKQLPHLRLLAYHEDCLVGHLGVDHRVVRFHRRAARIFGLIDLCVAEPQRGRGIATGLLEEVLQLAHNANVDAMLLIASDHRLYKKAGFSELNAECTWLRIDDHETLGVASESLAGELLCRPIANAGPDGPSLEGPVDFLGYLF